MNLEILPHSDGRFYYVKDIDTAELYYGNVKKPSKLNFSFGIHIHTEGGAVRSLRGKNFKIVSYKSPKKEAIYLGA